MALFVIQKDRTVACSWHIGSPFQTEIDKVEYIQADGDELEFIFDHMTMIPISLKSKAQPLRVQQWFGDIAKQITWMLICNNK